MDPTQHAQGTDAAMQHIPQNMYAEAQPGGSADHAAAHFAGFMPPAPEQQQLQQPAVVSATEAEAAAAAAAVTAAAAAVTAAAVEASEMTTAAAGAGAFGAGASASLQPVQHAKAEQLSYAAIREAAAVNQAADGAADEAMQTVAAAQQTLHMLMNPTPMTMQQHGMAGMEDDTSASTHHPSGRARRSRSSTGYMDHQGAAHLMGMAGGMYVPGGRPNKGLRHFSMKVCEKVESKGTTSYNEVADELVAELKDGGMDDGICYDEKNIRRRVYDAINVLMALDIIAKEKKAIIWKGFPTTRSAAQQVQRLHAEQINAMTEVGRKAQYLADLVEQQRALKHLLDRNSKQPDNVNTGTALHLPFILVQSKPDATVEVQISSDMQDVQFNFYHYPFEIHDDALVLRKMLEHDNAQKMAAAGHMAMPDGTSAMCIDGHMLTPEQQMMLQQHHAAMAAAAAAAAAAGHC